MGGKPPTDLYYENFLDPLHDKFLNTPLIARTKTTAVMQNVLGKNFLNDLCNTFKIPDTFFSLIMDEITDIAEIKQCANYSMSYLILTIYFY
jgi:hypothetical protein